MNLEPSASAVPEGPPGEQRRRSAFLASELKGFERLRDTDPAGALRLAEMCCSLCGDDETVIHGRCLRARAQALHLLSRFDESLDLYERARRILGRVGAEAEAARTAVGEVWLLRYLGRYEEALRLAGEARAVLQSRGWKLDEGKLLVNMAAVVRLQGHPSQALALLCEALEAFRAARHRQMLATTHMNMGNALAELGHLGEAMDHYQRARGLARRLGNRILDAMLSTNIAESLHFRSGDYHAALLELLSALRISEELGLRKEEAFAALAVAESYHALNLLDEADSFAARAAEVFTSLRMPFETGRARFLQGIVAANLAQAERAETAMAEACRLFAEQGNALWLAYAQAVEALLAATLPQASQSDLLGTVERAAERLHEGGARDRQAVALLASGKLLAGLGRQARAIEAHEAALALAEECGVPGVILPAAQGLGRLLRGSDRPRSVRHYRQAIEALEATRRRAGPPELRMSFAAGRADAYAELVELLLEDSSPAAAEEAFNWLERSRARTLSEGALAKPRAARPCDRRSQSEGELARARAELQRAYSRLFQLPLEADADGVHPECEAEVRALERRVGRLQREYDLHDEAIRGDPPAFASLREVRESLAPGQVMLYYFTLGDSVGCYLLEGRGFEVLRQMASRREVEGHLRRLRFQFARLAIPEWREGRLLEQSMAWVRAILRDLRRLLLPAAVRATPPQRLTIVPSGELHYLPFPALFDGSSYLLEEMRVHAVPSATVYAALAAHDWQAPERPLVLGCGTPSLPWVEREARQVASTFGGASLLLGEEASLAGVRRLAPSADGLHFASHAQFRSDNPSFSALRLADGWLTLRDLASLELRFKLATLSACHTGMAAISPGDEITGLAHTFLGAGCRTVIMSLWSVEDAATARIMIDFYGHLARGSAPAEALRQASLSAAQRQPHPYFWAPFTLLGAP